MSINLIQTPGPVTIFTSTAGSTSKAGDWYRVHPSIGRLTWQATLNTSSAGATAGSTVYIEVSNTPTSETTGPVPLATKGQTIALAGTTDAVSDGAVLASSMSGAWAWVRANMNSLTTSTAGTAGSPSVSVVMNAGMIGV